MAIYKTTFERVNFSFSVPIKQSIDIVFECDVEDEETEHDKMCEAACETFAEQVGDSFRKPEVGLMKKIGTGWSSILGGMTFERIEIPYADREIEQPTQERPAIACRFRIKDEKPFAGQVHSYRATGFYRLEEMAPEKLIENPKDGGEVAHNVIEKILREEYGDGPRFRIIKCLPEDATIISGTGVAGTVVPLKDVIIDGLVEWSDTKIKQAQGKYLDTVANYTEDNIMDDNLTFRHDWKREMAKKLGMIT